MQPDKKLTDYIFIMNSLLPEEYRIDVSDLKETKESVKKFYCKLEHQLSLYRLEYIKQTGEVEFVKDNPRKYSGPPKYLPDISKSFMNWRKEFQRMIDEDDKK